MEQTDPFELFPSAPFLEERLGREPFTALPRRPGIYRFYDDRGELLYVGKAKNLRTRLFSYKRIRAGQASRKVSQLISRIAAFEIETTQTEEEALLLENRWIRDKRPPFNHMNKQPETYYYVYIQQVREKASPWDVLFHPAFTQSAGIDPQQTVHPDRELSGTAGIEFRLAMRIDPETDRENWYGCFKGHAPVRRSLGCLLQLLWMIEYGAIAPHRLPVQLTRRLTPVRYQLNFRPDSPLLRDHAPGMIRSWMLGESEELLEWIAKRLGLVFSDPMNDLSGHEDYSQREPESCLVCEPERSSGEFFSRFQTRFIEHHLDCLNTFYRQKLLFHHRIRKEFLKEERHIIRQDELDDFVVRIQSRQP